MSETLPAAPITLQPAQLAVLAREIAVDIQELDDVLQTHGLSRAQYDLLLGNEFFKNLLEEETRNWQSVKGTPERIKLEAAAAFEKLMPTVFARLTNPNEGLRDVMEGAKLLAKVGGVDSSKDDRPTGEKFAITINIGAADQPPTIDIEATPVRVSIPETT